MEAGSKRIPQDKLAALADGAIRSAARRDWGRDRGLGDVTQRLGDVTQRLGT